MNNSKRFPRLSDMLLASVGLKGENWVAARLNVSQAAVSQWINGYKRPSRRKLIKLASLLQLDLIQLAEAAEYDPEEIRSLNERIMIEDVEFDDLLQAWSEEVNLLLELYLGGLPKRTIDFGLILNERLDKELAHHKSHKNRKSILNIRSQLLHVLGLTYISCLIPHQAAGALEHVALQLEDVAAEFHSVGLDDKRSLAWAQYARGHSYYALGKWEKAQRSFIGGLNLEKDYQYQFAFIHGIGLTSAYRGYDEKFTECVVWMKEYRERQASNTADETLVLEAEGRGQVLLRYDTAWEKIEKGLESLSKYESQGRPMLLRLLQYKRSKIVARLSLKPAGADLDLLISDLSEALSLARRHSYLKYSNDLEVLVRSYVRKHIHLSCLLDALRAK